MRWPAMAVRSLRNPVWCSLNGSSANFDSLTSRSSGFTIVGLLGAGPAADLTTVGNLSLTSNIDGLDGPASFRGDQLILRDGATVMAGGNITLATDIGTFDNSSTFASVVLFADDDTTQSLGPVTIDCRRRCRVRCAGWPRRYRQSQFPER